MAVRIDHQAGPPQDHDRHASPLPDARWRQRSVRGDRRPMTSHLVSSRLGRSELSRFNRRPARVPIARVDPMTFDCTRLKEAV